jgi:hypothetical protein
MPLFIMLLKLAASIVAAIIAHTSGGPQGSGNIRRTVRRVNFLTAIREVLRERSVVLNVTGDVSPLYVIPYSIRPGSTALR